MVDQKLVGELEKALTDEAYDGGMGALDTGEFRHLVRTLAVTAAEVVEKAHTPSDDEREALAGVIRDADMMLPAGSMALVEWSEHLAGSILAAGFRRSEVPEPQTIADSVERMREGETRRSLPSQPTDAQVAAAMREASRRSLMWRTSTDVKAVLRAASAITEQGEAENHG